MDSSYDPKADAVYITVGKGTFAETLEAGPFIYDVDAEGRVLGIEILSASRVLAPGDWKKAGLPNRSRSAAAE
ncbi:DUF2283 domain-containing protein [Rhodopseudomonas palustris]|nr:DUF2283 domain-containing protein [Rhodopseudomonas palustris]